MKAVRKRRKHSEPRQETLLQQLASMPDKLFTAKFRKQYAALCYRRVAGAGTIEVLLVTSRGTGRWIIPKGWPMKKKEPHKAAEIEAWEEAGVRGRARKKPVGRYTYLKWLENGDVAPCVVDVFEIEVKDVMEKYKECGQRELAWLTREEAARRVREVELKTLLVDFKPEWRHEHSGGENL